MTATVNLELRAALLVFRRNRVVFWDRKRASQNNLTHFVWPTHSITSYPPPTHKNSFRSSTHSSSFLCKGNFHFQYHVFSRWKVKAVRNESDFGKQTYIMNGKCSRKPQIIFSRKIINFQRSFWSNHARTNTTQQVSKWIIGKHKTTARCDAQLRHSRHKRALFGNYWKSF